MLNNGTVLQTRYQIVQHIGGGGMGDVYYANDLRLGNPAVVKENRGGDPQLFYAEARILSALRHPNLPRVIDHFVESNQAQFLVMDYIAGQNLEQIVQARGMLREQDALAWLNQISDAVKYLHANRIIHRDIKPQNIIITQSGVAMLVDFGIAKVMASGRPTVSAAHGIGSPGYAPLEQYYGGTDERSDIYALGATLYFALTALVPPSAPERGNGVPLRSIRAINPGVSAHVEQAIMAAMVVMTAQRLSSLDQFQNALRAPARVPTPPTQPITPSQVAPTVRATKHTSTWVWLASGIGVLFFAGLIGIGAFGFLLPGTDGAPMVSVPAGEFKMGSTDSDKDANSDEKPQHTVYLDAFWMDKFEVTNALYKKCVDAGKCMRPNQTKSNTRDSYFGNSQFNNYPVIDVDWNQAKTYCEWAGKRLPTEAEWEKAARGTDGRIYPWGNTFDKTLFNSGEGGMGDTTAVGNYPNGVSPNGVMDMAGNVFEWVNDWHGDYPSGLQRNPAGPSSGSARVLRGGAWGVIANSPRAALRLGDSPTNSHDFVGFRCARSL